MSDINQNQPSIMRYFEYDHLPEHLRSVSRSFAIMAELMLKKTTPGPEQLEGLRKLLEAKDCMVRAAL